MKSIIKALLAVAGVAAFGFSPAHAYDQAGQTAQSPGGVLIIDDYGHWAGARKAVDAYFGEHNLNLLLHRIDYSGRICVKVPELEFE